MKGGGGCVGPVWASPDLGHSPSLLPFEETPGNYAHTAVNRGALIGSGII